jgi:protein-tyrosine-phosphatase
MNILFVCVENSCRSQMAEGFANALRRQNVTAFSAGSRPSGSVNERAIAFMREKGIDISRQQSKGIDQLPGLQWDYIVTMGCGDACPALPARQRFDWDLPDPKGLDDEGFRAVRDRIEREVGQMVSAPAG